MRCLISGGLGFIASNLAIELAKQDNKVCILDNLSTGKLERIPKELNIEINIGSILDTKLVNKLIKDKDIVFHLAAVPSIIKSFEKPVSTSKVNFLGTLKLVQACRESDVKKFMFASSASVYGGESALDKNPRKESVLGTVLPSSPYAISKLASEMMQLGESVKNPNFDCTILRLFNVYGPNQNINSSYASVIPTFVNCIKNKKKPTINGNGFQSRDFVYVEDVVQAFIKLATVEKNNTTKNMIFNVGTGIGSSIHLLWNLFKELTGRDLDHLEGELRPGEPHHRYADISLIKDFIPEFPMTNLSDGIRAVLEFNKIKIV